jgi:hypothetical protein
VDLPVELGPSFAKGLEEKLSIAIFGKSRLAALSALQNEMDGAGILDVQLAAMNGC